MRVLDELVTGFLRVMEFLGTVALTVATFVLMLTVGTLDVLRATPHHATKKWA